MNAKENQQILTFEKLETGFLAVLFKSDISDYQIVVD